MELLIILLLLLPLLSPAASSSSRKLYQCDWCRRHSTASLLPPPNSSSDTTTDHAPGSACGYDMTMAELVPDGFHLAAASADFFRDDGASACYQLRCRDQTLCANEQGVKVVVVGMMEKTTTNGSSSGFLLTRDAFTEMMSSSHHQLAGLSHSNLLQVDFRRIPCEYRKRNLTVRVEYEGSRKPRSHLAVRFLYQGGLTDIAAVQVAPQVAGSPSGSTPSSSSWRSMSRRRNKQGVWHTAGVPAGPLQLRLVVTAGSGGKWLRTALPADWRPGGAYDTGIQVTDVAVRACSRSCSPAAGDDEDELR